MWLPGARGEINGNYELVGIEFQFGKMTNSGNEWQQWLHKNESILDTTKLCT